MEETAKLLSGLSLAELSETKRVDIIRRDVHKKFEERCMRVSNYALLERSSDDYLRARNSTVNRPSRLVDVAELDYILSSVETFSIEERIRLERRLQNKIRHCDEQLRGLVGLPPLYKKPVKRQRIRTEPEEKKRIISQFTKEGILESLDRRLSKEGAISIVGNKSFKPSQFAVGVDRHDLTS